MSSSKSEKSEGVAALSKFKPFLWPDHVIGKRESRRIRDEHNALYNSHYRLQQAIKALLVAIHGGGHAKAINRSNPLLVATAEAALEESENEN